MRIGGVPWRNGTGTGYPMIRVAIYSTKKPAVTRALVVEVFNMVVIGITKAPAVTRVLVACVSCCRFDTRTHINRYRYHQTRLSRRYIACIYLSQSF